MVCLQILGANCHLRAYWCYYDQHNRLSSSQNCHPFYNTAILKSAHCCIAVVSDACPHNKKYCHPLACTVRCKGLDLICINQKLPCKKFNFFGPCCTPIQCLSIWSDLDIQQNGNVRQSMHLQRLHLQNDPLSELNLCNCPH
jgi:hypothetical protein